jgi:DNA-binding XRE family transcriptional regulator
MAFVYGSIPGLSVDVAAARFLLRTLNSASRPSFTTNRTRSCSQFNRSNHPQSARERGDSQDELARRIGTHRTHVSRIERGRIAPTLAFLLRAASALGVQRVFLSVRAQAPTRIGETTDNDRA